MDIGRMSSIRSKVAAPDEDTTFPHLEVFPHRPCTSAALPVIKDNEANVAERFGHVPDVSCKPADAAPIQQPEILNQNWRRDHQIRTTQIRPKAQPAGVIREQRFLKGLATSKDLS